MKITAIKITFYADWVKSLKEKRTEVKRVTAAIQNKFHCSVTEADAQDTHKTIVIGAVYAAGDSAIADSQKEALVSFAERTARAQITDIVSETWDFE